MGLLSGLGFRLMRSSLEEDMRAQGFRGHDLERRLNSAQTAAMNGGLSMDGAAVYALTGSYAKGANVGRMPLMPSQRPPRGR